jgi:hypothetical protein
VIYVTIKDEKAEQANKWVTNLFPQAGDTFVVNKQKKINKQKFCVVSLPDDGSTFTEALKDHFGYTDYVDGWYNSRKIDKAHKKEKASSDTSVPGDQSDFIASLEDISDAE